ncbi:MAG TPA: hypothetical protein VIL85_11815 [Thermomicrobiales bacterium]|jgi:hypothetical protein
MSTLDNNRAYLYALDGVTRLLIPRPTEIVTERVSRGTNADGSERLARKRKVTWKFGQSYGMSEAQYLLFTANRPANGRVRIRTEWPAEGATGAHYTDVLAVMSPLLGVDRRGGRVYGLVVAFSQVEED